MALPVPTSRKGHSMTSVAFVNSRNWGEEDLVSCWVDSKQFHIVGVGEHRRIVALHLERYQWMSGRAAPERSGYERGGAGFFIQEGFKGNIKVIPGGTKVTLAAIKKRILEVVKEGRPLIIGGD
ncbi:hypothetical protein QOT17_008600 [Balamuthia mandrillaris]